MRERVIYECDSHGSDVLHEGTLSLVVADISGRLLRLAVDRMTVQRDPLVALAFALC